MLADPIDKFDSLEVKFDVRGRLTTGLSLSGVSIMEINYSNAGLRD
jgi:hypothetical protein